MTKAIIIAAALMGSAIRQEQLPCNFSVTCLMDAYLPSDARRSGMPQYRTMQPLWLFKLDIAQDIVGVIGTLAWAVIVCGAFALLYVLPPIIGWKKRNHIAIAALDLLTSWTVIGWVAALVWALTKDEDAIGAAREV